MSNEIKQEFSSKMAAEDGFVLVNDDIGVVMGSKCEQLDECKLKLEKAEAKFDKERDKIRQLVASANIRPKRTKISLNLSNFAKLAEQEEFFIYSHAVDAAGFQWKLLAQRRKEVESRDWLGLFLNSIPPAHYTGPYEIDICRSFHVLNIFPDKDITKRCDKTTFKHGNLGWGIEMVEIKKLLDKANGFLQSDGSVQLVAEFTVKTATLDHLLVDAVEEDVENKKDGN